MHSLLITVILALCAGSVLAFVEVCGVCGKKSGVACLDEANFALCDGDSKITPNRGKCPPKMYCTDEPEICSTNPYTPPCRSTCGLCREGRYTCKSNTTYSLCFGTDTPHEIEYDCPTGKICSTEKYAESGGTDFCYMLNELDTYQIDCRHTYSPIMPTPIPTTHSATAFCQAKGETGIYPNDLDETQRSYYKCLYENGVLFGILDSCPSTKKFNPTIGACITA